MQDVHMPVKYTGITARESAEIVLEKAKLLLSQGFFYRQAARRLYAAG